MAEIFIRRNLPGVLQSALHLLIRAAIQIVNDNPINYEELRSLVLRCVMNDSLRDELPRPDTGRRKGTGLFKSEDDFLTALFDVFKMFRVKPTLERVDARIRKHPLCQRKESKPPEKKQTGALRGWLKKAGFKNLDEAWDQYRSSLANSK